MRAPAASRVSGFTLIEVLLATVLLVAGLTLAFATLRSANTISQRGEAMAARGERMRAVEGFLRRSLTGALPLAMGRDPESQRPLRFVGEPARMRFVADVPDYLGRGGPYLHDLSVDGQAPKLRLQIVLAQVQSAQALTETRPLPPEPLADGLLEVRFAYRGRQDAFGTLGDWQPQWDASDRMPLLVRIDLRDAKGAWPPLVVALPQAPNARTEVQL